MSETSAAGPVHPRPPTASSHAPAGASDPGGAEYDPTVFPPFAVTVDLVVLTVRDDEFAALTVRRGENPFVGRLALPGGFVRPDEDLAAAARRELAEETGVVRLAGHLEQLGTYGEPGRDPRMRVVSVAHLVLAPDLPAPRAGTDAAEAAWFPVRRLVADGDDGDRPADGSPADADDVRLAFDHARILRDGVARARAKLEYTPLAAAFCPAEFTIAELRRVYEIVWGARLDPANFHRKVTGSDGFVVPTGATTTRGGGRPARLFRVGPADTLHPPILRPAPAGAAPEPPHARTRG